MRNPKSLLRGFTLIEFLIVVAIIGILAAIAVPNFQKFQARAKQSEAKIGLKGIWQTLTAFHAQHDTYRCHDPALGEHHVSNPAEDPFCGWVAPPHQRYTYSGGETYHAPATAAAAQNPDSHLGNCIKQTFAELSKITAQDFNIIAVSDIDNDEYCDVWMINEKGDIRNLHSDLNDTQLHQAEPINP